MTAGFLFLSAIPGRATGTRVYPSSALKIVEVGNSRLRWRGPGIHIHDGGYGFSDVQLHIKARRFASPRN